MRNPVMSRLLISLVLLCSVAVAQPQKNLTTKASKAEPQKEVYQKTAEKRWIPESVDAQPFSQNEFSSSDLRSAGQERAKEEKTLRDFIPYEKIQKTLINALKPKPILDMASQEERESISPGNTSSDILGSLIVRGSETFSKALNSVIDVPKKAFNKISEGATQALNQLGAYLVGL